MRMKRLEIRLQPCMKDCILNMLMKCEEMRMPFSNPHPNHRHPSPGVKDAHAAQRQQERSRPHLTQSLLQAFLRKGTNVAEEAERKRKLLFRKPMQAS